ncbi:hypothetical protein HDR58_02145 [bacterium]|nr:hypothetical protein [bacterium]
MEQTKNTCEVSTKDVLKHYLASIVIYGLILFVITFCPLFNETIENEKLNYIVFFIIYYLGYVIFALPIFLKFRPQSILESRNLTICRYFKRQFDKGLTTKEWLEKITPTQKESQSMMILFVKAFFGVYTINLLCNNYLTSLDYNFDFLREMFSQAYQYAASEGLFNGILQYIDDTADMWTKLTITLTTLILAFSYITELELFKNKVKSVDTTPLGVISCLICYPPLILLTNKLIPYLTQELIPAEILGLRIVLNILIVLIHLGSLFAIFRLGTKSGNLTNCGIVTGFPYNIIRHPDYTMQMCGYVLLTIPVYFIDSISIFEKLILVLGTCLWLYIYYLRAITEERHLIKDEEYQKYVEKVKYRFIPKVF